MQTNVYTQLTKAKELYDAKEFLAPIVSTVTIRQMESRIQRLLNEIQIDHERKHALKLEFAKQPTIFMLVCRIPEF